MNPKESVHTEGIAEHKIATLAGNTLRALSGSLDTLREQGLPADVFLRKHFRENRKFGSRDRHFLTKALFAYYRWYGWLEKVFPADTDLRMYLLGAFAAEGEMPLPFSLWCRELQLDEEKVTAAFAGATAEERLSLLIGRDCGCSDRDLLSSWMLPMLSPGAAEGYLPWLRSRPPVWIRIQKNREWVFRDFRENGIEWEENNRLPGSCRLISHGKVNLCLLPSYCGGSFEIQDYASQCIGYATGASGNEHWWDACAGGGGKTLLLATRLRESGGIVTATDIREHKLEETRIRAQRGSFENIRYAKWEHAVKRQYDGVLADVPCSSSGRWRRNPEMRLVCSAEWLAQLTQTQYEILERVCGSVKPGGYLTYGTCSVFQCENQEIVSRFLAEHPDFEPAPFAYNGNEVYEIQTYPADGDCDGTFCARLRRKDG